MRQEAVERLLQRLDDERFGPASATADGSIFLCEDVLLGTFKTRYPELPCLLLSEVDEKRVRQCPRVYVACPNILREEELASSIGRRFPAIAVTRFFGDHVLRIIARSPPDFSARDAVIADDLRKVAVISLPRSGSTHFAGLLTASGIGRCVEHLREPLVRLLLADSQCEPVTDQLFYLAQRNGFFSTKIISHFLLDLMRNGCGTGEALRFFERNRFRVIYLWRKDRVGQALSVFAARRTGVYYRQQADSGNWQYPEYVFDEILSTYRAFERQEAAIRRFVEQLPHVHWVTYEALCAHPAEELRGVFDFIGASGHPIAESSGVEKMPRGRAAEHAERFRDDYARRFGTFP